MERSKARSGACRKNARKPDSRTCQVCVSGIQPVEHGGMHRHPRSAIPGLGGMEPLLGQKAPSGVSPERIADHEGDLRLVAAILNDLLVMQGGSSVTLR
jgi:hypothetical protein